MPLPRRFARVLAPPLGAIAHGAIFTTWSELVFWGGPVEGIVEPAAILPTLLAYSVAGILVTALLSAASSGPLAAVLLAGAVLGVVVEGAVEATLYLDLPTSVSWTALAWHMTITVAFGWFALPRLATTWRGAIWLALAGTQWGAWAAFWPNERAWFPVHVFALYAHLSIAFATAAQAVLMRLPAAGPPIWLLLPAAALAAFVWSTKLALVGPVAVIAPALVAASVFGCLRLRRADGLSPLSLRRVPVTPGVLLRTALVPATATLVYGAFHGAQVSPATNIVVYLVTVPLGVVLWSGALGRALLVRRRRRVR